MLVLDSKYRKTVYKALVSLKPGISPVEAPEIDKRSNLISKVVFDLTL